ncbi:MAG: cytochrome P450 [Solirubrobacteraceae bacterium]
MIADRFPIGATLTLRELEGDPHLALARLRASEPVSWLPALDGWLVTRHDLVLAAMRDAETFTVDDPRFSTAQVIGSSMLSLDGSEHARHRTPFVAPFRAASVAQRFADAAAERARSLLDELEPRGGAELRRGFAGPMATSIIAQALGLDTSETGEVQRWYDAIVASVTEITAGGAPTRGGELAYESLRARLAPVISPADGSPAAGGSSLLAAAAAEGSLTEAQVCSNAAVLMFGGIETTEGMIANALLHLLRAGPAALGAAREDPAVLDGAIDESLRLEPAAAVIDRYATVDTQLGGAPIRRGDLVRLSLAAANRDPAVFDDPDRFDPSRPNLRRHVAFAQGPHVCVGVHLARLEARTAIDALLCRMGRLRLDPDGEARVSGLVFRKPVRLDVVWT